MPDPLTFTFLGTGTSTGVPMIGCECPVCRSPDPRNRRYRSSVLIGTPRGNILIDTTPEMRLQLLRANVRLVHAVVYTHYHADHLFGLDDARLFPRQLGGPLPLYCSDETEAIIRKAFAYAFRADTEHLPFGAVPRLEFRRVNPREPFDVLGQMMLSIPLEHAHYKVFGYRINDVAYCTDVNHIPDESWPLLERLEVLILDALRFKPHPAHFSLQQALEVIERVKPKRAYLTHIAHEIEHEATSRMLPAGVELAYDGLSFPF
jgi:phosphoribosyl 1,2-cyclic phosphate phosphodiesterase